MNVYSSFKALTVNNTIFSCISKPSVNSEKIQPVNRPMEMIDYEKIGRDLCKNSWQKDYTRLHQHLIETKGNKFVIYKCGKAGWGARCTNLLHTLTVAVITLRAFVVECDYPVPFTKFLIPRNINWNYRVNQTGLSVRKNARLLTESKNYSDPTIFRKMLTYQVEYEPRIGKPHLFIPKLLKYDLPTWPNDAQLMGCHYYYMFQKTQYLEKQLEEWKKRLGFHENIVLGIHIRQGDVVFNDGLGFGNRTTMKDIELCFECAVKIERLMTERHRTKKIIWFLAADNEKLKSYAQKKYGSKVKLVTGPIEHVAHPKKGNEEAGYLTMFLDFYLLQGSDYRLYNTVSSLDRLLDYTTFGSKNVVKMYNRKSASVCL